jgi:hypothetical protein
MILNLGLSIVLNLTHFEYQSKHMAHMGFSRRGNLLGWLVFDFHTAQSEVDSCVWNELEDVISSVVICSECHKSGGGASVFPHLPHLYMATHTLLSDFKTRQLWKGWMQHAVAAVPRTRRDLQVRCVDK